MGDYKRKILLMLIIVITAISAFVITASADEIGYVNATNGLNFRTGPGTDYEVITMITHGSAVTMHDCNDGWIYCTYNGETGYVSAEYITFIGETGGQRITPPKRTITGNRIVDEASKYIGIPYVYGAESPEDGFDCSGLVYYVYNGLGYSMKRTAADQATQGEYVSKDELVPGDLVFFGSSSYISHVGIYVGDGMMIHAPQTGYTVTYATIMSGYHFDNYVTARRLPPLAHLEQE